MADVKIYDSVLSQTNVDKIYQTFVYEHFPWYYANDNTTVGGNSTEIDGDEFTKEYIQFIHLFNLRDGTPNSGYVEMTNFILDSFLSKTNIKLKKLLKVKANFQTQNLLFDENSYNTPHVDDVTPHYVLLYYPHDSDGDTRIWSRKIGHPKTKYEILEKVSPTAGRFCLFNGDHYHCGAHPRISQKRIVINFNLDIEI